MLQKSGFSVGGSCETILAAGVPVEKDLDDFI